MRRLQKEVRDFLSRANEPVSPADFEIAKRMSAAFWFIGVGVAVALSPFDPPTEAFGGAGWLVAILLVFLAVGIGYWRLTTSEVTSLRELLVTSVVGVLLIAAMEWMAGGRDTPYHFLYWLPVLYASAAHRPSRVIPFFAGVSVAAALPLIYEGYSSGNALGIATQLFMFYAVGTSVWVMFVVLREQRAEIRSRRLTAEALALEDQLTGLGNRRAFDAAVEAEVARSERSGEPLCILVADLDNFKQVNDRYGHVVGDDVLKKVSRRLLAISRESDPCFRWGGDEFAMLLPGANVSQADLVARRAHTTVAEITTQRRSRVSITCGVAQWKGGMGIEELTEAADANLMALKRDETPELAVERQPT